MTVEAIKVASPKGLADEVAKGLRDRMQRAAALLDKAVPKMVEAWAWALRHAKLGYRGTLTAADVKPSGYQQACYTIARAVVETETSFEDLAELADGDDAKSIAKIATDTLREAGKIAAKGKEPRTDLAQAAHVVDTLMAIMDNLAKPRAERSKSNKGLPKPTDVPHFNVRECITAALAGQPVNIVLVADIPPQAVPVLVEAQHAQ